MEIVIKAPFDILRADPNNRRKKRRADRIPHGVSVILDGIRLLYVKSGQAQEVV